MPDTAVAGIGDFRIIRWLMGHWDEAQQIFDAIQIAIAAPTLREKIIALHPVLDAIAEIANDFPVGQFSAADEQNMAADVRAEADSRGINWKRLLEIYEKIKPFLPIILMFLGPKDET